MNIKSKAPYYLFFLFSGISALIYEVVWLRMFGLVMGNTTYSMTTVLVAFMGGLGLGGIVGGKIATRLKRPGRVYGIMEIGIAIYCIAVPFLIESFSPAFGWTYRTFTDSFMTQSLIRFGIGTFILIIPTALMGATLPILSSCVARSSETMGRQMGLLWATNTFGALIGSLISAFWLIPGYGLFASIEIAAALNLLAGVGAIAIDRMGKQTKEEKTTEIIEPAISEACQEAEEPVETLEVKTSERSIVLIAYGLSGFSAFVYQIAWMRFFSIQIGSTTYAFAMIVGVFILGLAIGGAILSPIVDRARGRLIPLLAVIELGIAISSILGLRYFENVPVWIVRIVSWYHGQFFAIYAMEFMILFKYLIIPTLLMGAAYPLVVRVATGSIRDVGPGVGATYASNTIGSIIGAFIGGFILIGTLGVNLSILLAAGVNMAAAFLLIIFSQMSTARRTIFMLASLLLFSLCVISLPPWRIEIMASSPYLNALSAEEEKMTSDEEIKDSFYRGGTLIFAKEGPSGIATVKESFLGTRMLAINGKVDGSTAADMTAQELLAHIPLILHPYPEDVLVVGLATGVTLSSVVSHPVRKAVCVELLESAIEASEKFSYANGNILENEKVKLIHNDARHHLMHSDESFDVIISEPTNIWISGMNNLFTSEFYEEASSRLKPGGVFAQWFQSYAISMDTFKIALSTFADKFPHVMLFEVTPGMDYLMIGSFEPLIIDVDRIEEAISHPDVKADLERISYASLQNILSAYILDDKGFREFVRGSEINTDDNIILEFRAAKDVFSVDVSKKVASDKISTPDNDPLKPLNLPPEIMEKVKRVRKAKSLNHEAGLLSLMGKHLLAKDRYLFALDLDPGNLEASMKLMEMVSSGNKNILSFDDSLEVTKRILEEYPPKDQANMLAGLLLSALPDKARSKKHFKEALRINPEIFYAYLVLASEALDRSKPSEAMGYIDTALNLAPRSRNGYLLKALVLDSMGERKQAKKAVKKALKISPHFKNAQKLLESFQ